MKFCGSLVVSVALMAFCACDNGAKSAKNELDPTDAVAMRERGNALFNGVAADEAKAVKWYRKAAEQGDAEAQFNLGYAYGFGQGVLKDEAEAVKWYYKAAEQGYAKAQFVLGVAYANGEGVLKNLVEAHAWFNVASAFGRKEGRNKRDSLEGEMTKEQITEATKRANELMGAIKKPE